MGLKIGGYEFEGVFKTPDEVPVGKGVYVVLCLENDDPHCVLYIGQSSQLRRRLRNHDKKECWQENVHGQIGFAIKRMFREENYNSPLVKHEENPYSTEDRKRIESELQWLIDSNCGNENHWGLKEKIHDHFESHREAYGPRGAHEIDGSMNIEGYDFDVYDKLRKAPRNVRGIVLVVDMIEKESEYNLERRARSPADLRRLKEKEPRSVLDIEFGSNLPSLRSNNPKKCWTENAKGDIYYFIKERGNMDDVVIDSNTPPPLSNSDSPDKLNVIYGELEWKFHYPCGSNYYDVIAKRESQRYRVFKESLGPRNSYKI